MIFLVRRQRDREFRACKLHAVRVVAKIECGSAQSGAPHRGARLPPLEDHGTQRLSSDSVQAQIGSDCDWRTGETSHKLCNNCASSC